MIRYRLDELGWYQFEWLLQSLLKAALGLAIESWGGRRDFGRDAYTTSRLRFPKPDSESEGPFLFQMKFVEGANAAGAKVDQLISSAVHREAGRFARRKRLRPVRHYLLFTNAPLSAELRERLATAIGTALPAAEVHLYGGTDVCDLLDQHPTLRRAFPQLLSLRDLDTILLDAINKDTLERSRSAVTLARDLVPVFVPTEGYRWAWEMLRANGFIVLEGPPEVGKSAIAWMIGLVQLSQGWEALVCDTPEDFFRTYVDDAKQVFIADDAFGRTEYNPARGRDWERQLERVLKRTDAHHWFIWTSRKHIFERALKEMDLQGTAGQFPHKAGIIVDATRLSTQERALMLYRHARAAGLEHAAKELVRQNARLIIETPEFTPERIRRFVRERLSELAERRRGGMLKENDVKAEIVEAIRNPTDRMRKTFNCLSREHKWLLISMLEAGAAGLPQVRAAFIRHIQERPGCSFEEIVDELRESFVRVESNWFIDWTHPSYRDLVIEELAKDNVLREELLKSVTLAGLRIAISDAGGAQGERAYPFMRSERDWSALSEGCRALLEDASTSVAREVLTVLQSSATNAGEPHVKEKLDALLLMACEMVRTLWDSRDAPIGPRELDAYCRASALISPLPTLPRLDRRWSQLEEDVRKGLSAWIAAGSVDEDVVGRWLEFVELVRDNEPRVLIQKGFPETQKTLAEEILGIIEDEVELEVNDVIDEEDESDPASAYRDLSVHYLQVRKIVSAMVSLGLVSGETIDELEDDMRGREAEADQRAEELKEEKEEDEKTQYSRYSSGTSVRAKGLAAEFTIESLFEDL